MESDDLSFFGKNSKDVALEGFDGNCYDFYEDVEEEDYDDELVMDVQEANDVGMGDSMEVVDNKSEGMEESEDMEHSEEKGEVESVNQQEKLGRFFYWWENEGTGSVYPSGKAF